MALVKAKIIVEHPREEFVKAPRQEFTVLFNPEEYTINKDNNYASMAIPGLSSPLLQFVHGNLGTLEMELLFDTYDTNTLEKQDVREITSKFMKLMDIDPKLHAPPVLLFSWATLQFRGVLARASQKFILFWHDGRPVRARISATFNEYVDPEEEARRVGRQTADYTKVHTVLQGETLSGIATGYYKNPQTWRPIALANNLDDPRRLTPGQKLRIPALPFTDPESGEVMR